jgi:hypothetical protein
MQPFSYIIKNPKAKPAYQIFGISEHRRIKLEIATRDICQKLYDNDKKFVLQEILIELENKYDIFPQDESDLAWIMFSTAMTIMFYCESAGMTYNPEDLN